MHTHTAQHDPGSDRGADDRETLLDALSTIREEVTSLKSAMRGMLRENLRLKHELGAAAEAPQEDAVAELNRVRQEVDELVRRYDAASPRRPERPAPPPRYEAPAAAPRGDRMRTMMMMMMMMSELL